MSYHGVAPFEISRDILQKVTEVHGREYYQFVGPVNASLSIGEGETSEFALWHFSFLDKEYVVIMRGMNSGSESGDEPEPLVRIQSHCNWCHVLGSSQCDCSQQFENAKRRIAHDNQGGMIVYCLNEHGRGISLQNDFRIHNKAQTHGIEECAVRRLAGFKGDYRKLSKVIAILKHFEVERFRLITNNPRRIEMYNLAMLGSP